MVLLMWNCLIIDDEFYKKYFDYHKQDVEIEWDIETRADVRIVVTYWSKFYKYNLNDFDIFFINFKNDKYLNKNEVKNLYKLGSGELKQIKFVFAERMRCYELTKSGRKKDEYREWNDDIIKYLWKDIPNGIEKNGTKIIPRKSENELTKLIFINSGLKFEWKWSVSKQRLPENFQKLAQNKEGDIISFILKKNNNFVLIVPHPTDIKKFIEYCLNNLQKIDNELKLQDIEISIKKPAWLEEYDPFDKRSLIKDFDKLNDTISRIKIFEILLYGYDKPLEKAVRKVFSFLEFKNIKSTVDRTDMRCETEKTKIIAEIKGLKENAHERNITQMYKWHAEELEKIKGNEKPIKQIFICNGYRSVNPDLRELFFDDNVISIAKTHNWGLLSTVELFQSLFRIHRNELSKEEVRNKIETTSGIIKFTETQVS